MSILSYLFPLFCKIRWGPKFFRREKISCNTFLKEGGGGNSKGMEEDAKLQDTREFVFSVRVLTAGEEVRSKLFSQGGATDRDV